MDSQFATNHSTKSFLRSVSGLGLASVEVLAKTYVMSLKENAARMSIEATPSFKLGT